MRPLLSEFSYGYALTEELSSGRFGRLVGAPIFPSLIQEGQPGGGYDLKLPLIGAPLYLQFKLSDCMVYRSAAEWHLFQRRYFRMHLRPARHSDQHDLLCQLEARGEQVYYVAPHFYTTDLLNEYYSFRTVAEHSVWFRPQQIGALPDENDHYIAFHPDEPVSYLCSEDPRPLESMSDKKRVVHEQESIIKRRSKKVDKHFFTEIAEELLSVAKEGRSDTRFVDSKVFRETRRKSLRQEAQFAAFLSRSLFNAELIILAESNLEQ